RTGRRRIDAPDKEFRFFEEPTARAPPAPAPAARLDRPQGPFVLSSSQSITRGWHMSGTGEVRMLIGGDLVEAASGKTFDNINPATEEVLGPVADASTDDMRAAIRSARRAFDDTDWSTNRALRKR